MYKLLIVDDEVSIREGLSKIIQWEKLGFRLIGTADCADAALRILQDESVDVLLTDINMPRMTGLELTHIFKEKYPRLRTVIISGYSEFEYAQESIRLKVEAYILKPIDPQQINEVFTDIKQSLDEERRQVSSDHFLLAKIELLRSIYGDVNNLKYIRSRSEETNTYTLVLFQLITRDGALISEELLDSLHKTFISQCTGGYCHRAYNLFSILMISGKFDVDDLKEELPDYVEGRFVISSEFAELSDVVGRYFFMANSLFDADQGDVKVCNQSHYSTEDNLLDSYFLRFIESIEQDRRNDKQVIEQLFEQINLLQDANYLYLPVKLLKRVALYFEVDIFEFPTLNAHYATNFSGGQESLDSVRSAFATDYQVLVKEIRAKSERLDVFISQQARQLIDTAYGNKDLSLKYAAEHLNVSYGYLSTSFSRNFGMSFSSYLNERRLDVARDLLLSRKLRVYEIASYVGYSSSRYFTQAFKKHYGVSPTDYLLQISGARDGAEGGDEKD